VVRILTPYWEPSRQASFEVKIKRLKEVVMSCFTWAVTCKEGEIHETPTRRFMYRGKLLNVCPFCEELLIDNRSLLYTAEGKSHREVLTYWTKENPPPR